MALEGVIHAIHVMGHPAGVCFHAHHFQLRKPFEHATENQRADNVLITPNDGHEAVHARPAHPFAAARENVKRQRQI